MPKMKLPRFLSLSTPDFKRAREEEVERKKAKEKAKKDGKDAKDVGG